LNSLRISLKTERRIFQHPDKTVETGFITATARLAPAEVVGQWSSVDDSLRRCHACPTWAFLLLLLDLFQARYAFMNVVDSQRRDARLRVCLGTHCSLPHSTILAYDRIDPDLLAKSWVKREKNSKRCADTSQRQAICCLRHWSGVNFNIQTERRLAIALFGWRNLSLVRVSTATRGAGVPCTDSTSSNCSVFYSYTSLLLDAWYSWRRWAVVWLSARGNQMCCRHQHARPYFPYCFELGTPAVQPQRLVFKNVALAYNPNNTLNITKKREKPFCFPSTVIMKPITY